MTAAAQATTSLKVASMVLNTDLRHPAVLARELASIDVLSEGRLEVGLGAGYNPLDYRRSGIPMDPPGVRVDRLIEHAKILRALWATGPTTFHGEHYRITELDGTPKPFRPGGPPLLIAGGGRRMLRFAAGFADIVGVNVALPAAPDATSARDALPDAIDAKIALLRADAGSRLDAVELNAWLSVCRVTTDARSVGEQIAHRFGAPASEVLDSPFVLAGPTEEMIDRLCQRRTRWGYSYVVVPGPSVEAFAPVVAALTGR
jgi:probable F420-dependent oxidoreductase